MDRGRVIDISGPLTNGMWSYGAPFPAVATERVAALDTHGYDGHAFRLHSLAGTYLETARHLYAGRETLDAVRPERLWLRARVAQLPDKAALEPITAAELEAAVGKTLRPGEALLLSTGWDSRWNQDDYLTACPYLSPSAMEWIVERDVGLLGVDIPSIEDPRKPDAEMKLLARYYEQDRLLLAPAVRLREAGSGRWRLAALPLPVAGVCAAPCRALLFGGEPEDEQAAD